jgi:hypothetical protein
LSLLLNKETLNCDIVDKDEFTLAIPDERSYLET